MVIFAETKVYSMDKEKDIALRKFCVEKAVEIFSWHQNFFYNNDHGPLQLAEVIYTFIKEGKLERFPLPGAGKNHVQ